MEVLLHDGDGNILTAQSTIDDVLSFNDTISTGALDALGDSVYSIVVGAHAMYRLFRQYQGPQIRIRRSDNAEVDVYFDKNGTNITPDLDIWLSGATAYIVIWYDQGPTQNHTIGYALGGATLPLLVKRTDTGYVGKYTASLTGAGPSVGNYFQTINSVTFNEVAQGGVSTFTCANFKDVNSSEHVYDYNKGTFLNDNIRLFRTGTGTALTFNYAVGTTSTGVNLTNANITNAWKAYGARLAGANPPSTWRFDIRVNATTSGSTTTMGGFTYSNRTYSGSRTLTTNWIGRPSTGYDMANMDICCQIFFNDNLSNAQFAIMEAVF